MFMLIAKCIAENPANYSKELRVETVRELRRLATAKNESENVQLAAAKMLLDICRYEETLNTAP